MTRIDLPVSVWIHQVGPFLTRSDYNKVSRLNREFHQESLTAVPPWPERHFEFEASPYACSLAFDHSGQWLALASGILHLWHVRLGRCLQGPNTISVHPWVHVQFSERYLMSATYHTIRFWSLPTIEDSALRQHDGIETLSTYPHVILSLTIIESSSSPSFSRSSVDGDDNLLLVGHMATPAAPPRVASIYDISTSECIQVFGETMRPMITNAYSVLDCSRQVVDDKNHVRHEESYALIGDSTGTIHVWNHERERKRENQTIKYPPIEATLSWKAHDSKLQHIELVSNSVLATCSLAGSSGTMARTVDRKATMKLWDLKTDPPECIGTSSPKMRALNMGVMDMSVSPKSNSPRTVAFGDATGTLNIWNIDEIIKLQSAGESDDLASESRQSSPPRLSSLRRRALLRTLQGNHGALPIKAVAFSPDGKVIASACGDGTLQLWLTPSLSKKKVQNKILLSGSDD